MSDGKTEVLFCTDGIFPHAVGGMQRHSALLIEELARYDNISLTVVHPHKGISVFNHPAIREIVVAPPESSGRYLIDCYRYSKLVYEIAITYPNAVIYSQGLAVWYGIGKIGKRVIVNPHGLESYQTLSFRDYAIGIPFRMIFNHLFRKAAKVVSLGGRLTGILQKVMPAGKIEVLPNATIVPPPVHRDFANEPVRLLFVGRFALNKGISVLAEAVKALNEEGCESKFEFNLVGKGPLFEEYSAKYAFSNLHFLGFADDDRLRELYQTNDVFVLPTLFEGMPTVVLEAMAYGMPVIVTDVGATLELVDASNGMIIEKNDVGSLKNAIIAFGSLDEATRRRLSASSYRKVSEKFTWKIVAGRHVRLFQEISSTLS
jgi:glycosyltransferase involved in cell wall biosynthesis